MKFLITNRYLTIKDIYSSSSETATKISFVRKNKYFGNFSVCVPNLALTVYEIFIIFCLTMLHSERYSRDHMK